MQQPYQSARKSVKKLTSCGLMRCSMLPMTRIIDAKFCLCICFFKGLFKLIDELEQEDMMDVLTEEQRVRLGWWDYQ